MITILLSVAEGRRAAADSGIVDLSAAKLSDNAQGS